MDLRKPLQRSLRDKRGMGIGDIYPALLVIALVAILIGVILFVLDEFADQIGASGQINGVVNETGAYINITGYPLNAAGNCSFQTPVITAVWNETTKVPLLSGNYTVSSVGVLTNASTSAYSTNSYGVNVSYTYKGGGTACEATEEIIEEIADFVPWIGIILLVIAAAIVLGLLVRNLAGGQRV